MKTTFETFRKLGSFEIDRMTEKEPSCFNRIVAIRKYRVTIEEVQESDEVLIARLRKLWAETKNHHSWDVLQAEAKRLGIILKHSDLPTARS